MTDLINILEAIKDLSNTPQTELTDIKGIAAMLNIGESTANRLDASGRLPMPVRIGKSKKWRIHEIQKWIQEGAPARTKWEALKQKYDFK